MANATSVLEFWFGKNPDDPKTVGERLSKWFTRNDAFDAEVRRTLGDAAEQAARGELDGWAQSSPRERLALVLLLDQVPRNLHRGDKRAFATDDKAQKVVTEGLSKGDEVSLSFLERAFFYMPLEHSERLEHQRWSVQRFEKLHGDAPPELKETLRSFLDYARRHHYVIDKFGRFAHRNAVLGRQTTQQEADFLAKHPEGF